MRRLGLLARIKRTRDHGAVATIVTVFLAGGVVMGMLALSADIGSIMSERRQVQNGADASAMALGALCATKDPGCADATAAAAVKPYANANAKDNLTAISNVCAHGVATITNPCEVGDASDLGKCAPAPGWLTSAFPYVEVKARTQTSGGTGVFTPFARALTGSSNTYVTSCARSSWGPPSSYTGTIPVVFSACEWQNFMTADGGVYPPGPGSAGYGSGPGQVPWPAASLERIIYLYSANPSNCAFKGKDTDGGFGWVQSANCEATVSTAGWVQIDTGKSMPAGCKPVLASLYNKVIAIPVFDCLVKDNNTPTYTDITPLNCNPSQAGGAKSWYHIKGWATYYLSGYRAPSMTAASGASGAVPCSNPDSCLSGWFLNGQLAGASSITPPGGDTDFGTYAVLPAG
jgi:Flp pilus assembly protein TadG